MCFCVHIIFTYLWTCVCHRDVKDKVHDYGEIALGFAGAYYEEHIQPVTASYVEWASDVRSSVLKKIKTTFDDYMPFKAKPADQPPLN